MKISYDATVDAAYLYIVDHPTDHGPISTVCLLDKTMPGGINVDFGVDGKIVGIEFLSASELLSQSVLNSET
jgi:uncharacterized protein YuzE